MSSFALMSIGKTAMFANYAALQVTGNNIANANTVGYSRQQADLATVDGQATGSGFFGKGVSVQTVTRAYDQFLTNQAATTSSVASSDSTRLDRLNQLESVFPTGDTGLGSAAGSLLNSFVDVANDPSDSSARQVVLSQTQELASQFQAAGNQLSTLQTGVTQDVTTMVGSVNGLTQQVAALNLQIAALQSQGQPPNDLLDQRDQLVKQIGQYINVTTVPADDGSVGLFVGGGQSLVLGSTASTLKAIPDTYDPAKVQVALVEGSANRQIPANSLSGGSIAGLLKFQNDDLTAATNLLGQMSTAISSSLNQQQALGLDLGQPPKAGQPMFSIGAPRSLAATTNTGNASLSVTVTDATHVQASDYSLRFDGTNYTMTRLSDQQTSIGSPFSAAQLAAGVEVDGMTVQLNTGTPNAGDSFLLQPVAQAAQNMKAVLSDPNSIAAASPFTATVGAANTGTAAIGSISAVSPSYNGSLSANIAFTSSTGDYSWTMSDGSSGTGTWTAGTPISLNGFALNLSGVPSSGDTIAVTPTVSTASNNGNALAFNALADSQIVGATLRPDGSQIAGQTITDAYASTIAAIGVRVQSGKSASDVSTAIANDAETARANKDGVNLDEEASRLIQFQQSYQAAAKILQVAQTVFDALLQTAAAAT